MKTWLTSAGMIVLLIGYATGSAQQVQPDRAAEIEARVEEAKSRLELTDDQVTEVRPVLRAHVEATVRILEGHGIDLQQDPAERQRPNFREMRAIRKDLESVRDETNAKIAVILTEEQMDEFERIQEERQDEMRDRIRARQ